MILEFQPGAWYLCTRTIMSPATGKIAFLKGHAYNCEFIGSYSGMDHATFIGLEDASSFAWKVDEVLKSSFSNYCNGIGAAYEVSWR